MAKKKKSSVNCCLCNKNIEIKDSFNPFPLHKNENSRCCEDCNGKFVIVARAEYFENH